MPAEIIARIAKVHKGNKYRLGHIATDETKEKLRASKLGKKHSQETKIKMKASHAKAPPRDPAWGAKISAAKMGHKQSEATKDKLRSWVRSPELCARISAATKEAMKRPEVRARLGRHRTEESPDAHR